MRHVDPSDRRIRRSWWIFSLAFLFVALLAVVHALDPAATLADRLLVGVVLIAGIAAIVHGSAVRELDERRRGEAE